MEAYILSSRKDATEKKLLLLLFHKRIGIKVQRSAKKCYSSSYDAKMTCRLPELTSFKQTKRTPGIDGLFWGENDEMRFEAVDKPLLQVL